MNKEIDGVDGALAAGFKRASPVCQQVAIERESPVLGESLITFPMTHRLWAMFFPCGQSLESRQHEIGRIGAIG